MVSSFSIKLCAVLCVLVYLNGNSVHAIFNDQIDSLINVLHHGQEAGGLGQIFGRGRTRNNNKDHDHDDDHDHDHGQSHSTRGSTRTNGKNRGTQSRNKSRTKCECPGTRQYTGNSGLLNGLNDIQNVEMLQAIIRALVSSPNSNHGLGTVGNVGNSYGSLDGLGNSGLGGTIGSSPGVGSSIGSHHGLGGVGSTIESHHGLDGHTGISTGTLHGLVGHGHSVSHQGYNGHGNTVSHNGYSGLGIFGSHNSHGHGNVGWASSPPSHTLGGSYGGGKTVYKSGFVKKGVTVDYDGIPAHSNLVEKTAGAAPSDEVDTDSNSGKNG